MKKAFLSFAFVAVSLSRAESVNTLPAPVVYDLEKSSFYNPRNFGDLYDFLEHKKVKYPLLMTCVAMVECGDSLNCDDVFLRNNYFGITKICADDMRFAYEGYDCRWDACYVRFCSPNENVEFIKSWEKKISNVYSIDEFHWICYVRRYNPGNPNYINLLYSKKKFVEQYLKSRRKV